MIASEQRDVWALGAPADERNAALEGLAGAGLHPAGCRRQAAHAVAAARQEGLPRHLGQLVRLPFRLARVAATLRELKDKDFMVVAVAEESRGADHARPWIEQAKSDYWQLIDTEHRLERSLQSRERAAGDLDRRAGQDRAAARDGRLDRSLPPHGPQDPHHVARGPGGAAGRAPGLSRRRARLGDDRQACAAGRCSARRTCPR